MAVSPQPESPPGSLGEIRRLEAEVERLKGELRQAEEVHRSLRESLPVAVFFKDVEGRFIHVNQVLCDRVGRKEDELLGRTDFDLFPRELALKFRSDDERALASGELIHEVEEHPGAGGEQRYIETFKKAVRSEAGAIGVYGIFWDVTERERLQSELREKRSILQTFVEHTPAAVAMFDTEMRYLAWSRRWVTDYRIQDGNLRGRSHYEVFPEIGEDWKAIHRRCLAGARESREEDSFVRADGEIDYVRWEVLPWRDDDGVIGGLVMYTDVITDRVKTEAEARLSAFGVERANVAFFLVGRQAEIMRVNQVTCDMLEYSREALEQLTIYDINPDLKDGEWEPHWQELRERRHILFEARMITRGRRIFPVEVEINYLEFEGTEYNFAFVRDITARKEAEERLRSSEERLRLVASVARDGIWEVDVAAGTFWWNETYDRVFGPRPRRTCGDKEWWLERIDERERAGVRDSYAARLADPTSDSWAADYHFTTDAGLRLFVQDRALILRGEDGRPQRVVGSMRDQTSLEDAILEREEIEKKVLETQKLESLGVLAGGIAHDFNNLLTAMLGNVSLVKAEIAPASDHAAILGNVEDAAFRAADLCKQMLAYAGEGRFVLENVNLSVAVREMTQLLSVSISKSAQLQFHLADDLPPVRADPTQINQIIMNLVVNASEAIGDQEGVISLSTGQVEADEVYLKGTLLAPDLPAGNYVCLEVGDTGSGMAEETRARMFDPFFTTKFTGRGLGLAAVQGIVRGHHGALKVCSELGEGTTFRILFPAAEGRASLHGGAPVGERGQVIESGLILVVDDEEPVRRTARRVLTRKGFEVIEAEDGEAGVALFRERSDEVCLVLLDLTMPRMDGVAAFALLRKIAPETPVLLMSGYNELKAVQQFAGRGLAGFLQKPFTAAGLVGKALSILDAGERGATGEA